MFIKKIVKTDKTTSKRYNYYRLCKGYRVGKKVRHRIILGMGSLEGVETKSDRKLLADLIEMYVLGVQEPFSSTIAPKIEQYAQEFSHRIISEKLLDVSPSPSEKKKENTPPVSYEQVDVNSIAHEQVREIGAEWLCKQAMEQLGIKHLLETKCGFSLKIADVCQAHIVSRALYPASENKTAEWIKENSSVAGLFNIPLDKINRFKLYAASKRLYQKKTILEQHLSKKTCELFDIQDKILFYDLTNSYFEGRKEGSTLAKYGRSKEKRSDSKIVSLGAVINSEGFIKYSRICEGNISESKTLEKTIQEMKRQTSELKSKPVIVMDGGIMTADNMEMLQKNGYDYLCVTRSKLKYYKEVDAKGKDVKVYDKKGNTIRLRRVKKQGCSDTYMYVRSDQKAVKEASMNRQFSQRFQEEIDNVNKALIKKGGTKKLEKVWERIERIKERYPTVNNHYSLIVTPDKENKNALSVKSVEKTHKPKETEGVYFIRTNLKKDEEKNLWTIYNTLTEIESTFRVLKTDLALRPIYHKNDENIEAHLFLGILAYQLVSTLRHQLKQKGIRYDWKNIVRIMNTQKEITSVMKCKSGNFIRIKKCSTPILETKQIYEALGYHFYPYSMKKYVVPNV